MSVSNNALTNYLLLLESSSGASWNPVKTVETGGLVRDIHTLSGIQYHDGSDSMQSLDITFPKEHLVIEQTSKLPVLVFVHGGGWSRGGKDVQFYGTPSVRNHMAASACIAIAPGYRLGKYPEFLHDVVLAIRWVKDNVADLGGDPDNIYLGGHSAGGHIASLLLLRHADFLAKEDIPKDFFCGLILLSGVYDLFCPLKKSLLDVKNKIFVYGYVKPAFGTDNTLLRQASPLLLLNPDKDTSILGRAGLLVKTSPVGRASTLLTRGISQRLRCKQQVLGSGDLQEDTNEDASKSHKKVDEYENTHAECEEEGTDKYAPFKIMSQDIEEDALSDSEIELNTDGLPKIMICNAYLDMGLQENGKLMADAMSKYTSVEYQIIPYTDHGSICWSESTFVAMRQFMGLAE